MTQRNFLKSKIKEKDLLEGLENLYDFDIVKGGLGFVGIKGDNHPRPAHIKAAEQTWAEAKKAIESKKYDLSDQALYRAFV